MPIAIFFILLFFGLLLGDGKQGTIEVYGVSILIVCWVYYAFKKKHIRHIPTTLGLPWVVFVVSVAISTILSDSVGLSLSWMIRLASGYLIYRLFYSIATKETARATAKSLLVFAAGASLLSLLASVYSPLRSILPSMNLIDLRYGHNHLADLLVFVSPIVVSLVLYSHQSKPAKIAVTLGVVFFLLLTYARGAWLIVATYGAVAYGLWNTNGRAKRTFIVVTTVVLVSAFSYGYGRVFMAQKTISGGSADFSRVARPLTFESRLEYWRQAILGIKERPVFGSGPGTFSLTSTRLQNRVNQSSWFAHSILLQTGSEMGVIGLLAFLWLIGAHARLYIKHRSVFAPGKPETAMLWGLVLTLVYSLFEYVLDYQVIWLLFWSTMGLTAGIVRADTSRVSASHISIAAPLASVALFYLLWILSGFVALTTGRYDLAFYVAPFDAGNALVMLNTHDVTQAEPNIAFVWVFHKNNPEILKELAAYYSKRGRDEKARELLSRVVVLDPKNIELAQDYLKRIATLDSQTTGEKLLALLRSALPRELSDRVSELTPYTKQVGEAAKEVVELRPPLREQYASLLYLMGLHKIQSDPQLTKLLWHMAKDIKPDVAAFYIELARYYQHTKHDNYVAQEVLLSCIKNESAKHQCREFVGKDLLPPGDFYDALR